MCQFLGGTLAMAIKDSQHIVGDAASCGSNSFGDSVQFWAPVVLDKYSPSKNEYTWIDDRTGSMSKIQDQIWANAQPNGEGISQCVALMNVSGEYFWNDIHCQKKLCPACVVPEVQTFYLRGQKMANQCDSKYALFLAMQNDKSKLVFEGQSGLSKVIWSPLEKTTELQTASGSSKLKIDQNPFGYWYGMDWVFTNVSEFFCQVSTCLPQLCHVLFFLTFLVPVQSRNTIYMLKWEMCVFGKAL